MRIHFTENFEGILIQLRLLPILSVKRFIYFRYRKCLDVKGFVFSSLLTENGIIAAPHKLGRTPVILGKRKMLLLWLLKQLLFRIRDMK